MGGHLSPAQSGWQTIIEDSGFRVQGSEGASAFPDGLFVHKNIVRANAGLMITLNEAYAKLGALSEERARLVIELIADLAELEAREDAEDLAIAREALARVEAGGKVYSWEEVKARLDANEENKREK